MQGTKYLSEMMQDVEINSNTLVVSPCGSGKTYYILNELCKDKKCLYLCDTINLREQVMYSIEDKDNIETMTYHKFGSVVKNDTLNRFINSFDLIVADEIHNLIDYQKMDNSGDLMASRIKLFDKYENTKIVMFTGTPYNLNRLAKDNIDIDAHFVCYDFSKSKEIKRYVNKRKGFINHISQIQFALEEYREAFEYRDMKCLIYTRHIEDMFYIRDMCLEKNLRPVCIWSLNAEKYNMDNEQLSVREELLKTGILKDPFNVLIINRSMETGVNIYDELMQLVIVNTANVTQIEQSRGRVRHDIDLLVVRTNKKDNIFLESFELPDEFLNIPMRKEDIEEQIIHLAGLKDKKGRFLSVKGFGKLLETKGYTIKSERRMINRERMTLYTIIKK